MKLQGTAQVGLVSPNKFKNFQIFWLTLPYLYSKEKTHLNICCTLSGTCMNPCIQGIKKTVAGERSAFLNKRKVVSLQCLWGEGLIDWQGSLLKYATRLNGRVLERETSSWNLSTVADQANESRSMALKSAYNIEKKSLNKTYIERGGRSLTSG